MRMWMRFITTSPEFSWGGTIAIVVVSAFAGGVLGLARLRRSRGGAGWWRLSLLAILPLGAGGAVMWPAVILGAIALGRPRPRWLRAVLGTAALATQVPVIGEVAFNNWRLSPAEGVLAAMWYLPMLAIETWAFSVAFAPSLEGATALSRPRRVALAVPMVVVVVLAAVAMGLAGDM
jgi:hypothetical protein